MILKKRCPLTGDNRRVRVAIMTAASNKIRANKKAMLPERMAFFIVTSDAGVR